MHAVAFAERFSAKAMWSCGRTRPGQQPCAAFTGNSRDLGSAGCSLL